MEHLQVESSHYNFLNYIDKKRFFSFYYQLSLIQELNCTTVMEIGTGSRFLRHCIEHEYEYTGVDIDISLQPDIVGSITDIPAKSESFDIVACFQVLEHLKYEQFDTALKEIYRVAKKNAIISLPYRGYHYYLTLKLPVLKTRTLQIFIPKFLTSFKFTDQHQWTIGFKEYPLKKIIKNIENYFNIKKTIHPLEHKYHIFFVLEKK
ncbi:MAG: class I SAM-dependent methyltransferase [Spirochaetes bacterium]|jgi:hypothetical protein|nr:class I SAM-dependent methyltransferase [Spirochaetota bacterium]